MASHFLNMRKKRLSFVALFLSLSSSLTVFTTSPMRAVPAIQQVGNVVYSTATISHGLTNLTNLHFIQMVGLKGTLAETSNAGLSTGFNIRVVMKHPFSVRVNRSAVGHAAMNAVVFIIGKQSWFSTWQAAVVTAGGTAQLGTCAGGPVIDMTMPTGSEATGCDKLGDFYVSLRAATIADSDFTTHYQLMSTEGRIDVNAQSPGVCGDNFYALFKRDGFVAFSTSQTAPIYIPACPQYILHLAQANLTATLGRSALTKWQLDSSGHFVCIGNYTPAALAGHLVSFLVKAILEATPAINQNLAGSSCNNLRGDIQVANYANTDMVPVAIYDLGPADAVGLVAAGVVKSQFVAAQSNIAGALFRTKWEVIGGRALVCVQLYDGGPTFLTGKNRYGALLDTTALAKTAYGTTSTMRTKLWVDWASSYGTEQTNRLPGGSVGPAATIAGYLDWLMCMMGAEQSYSNVTSATAANVPQADKDSFADSVANRINDKLVATGSGPTPDAGLFNVFNFIGANP